MKVSEALEIVHQTDAQTRRFDLVLACGFTPLHLQTFVAAFLQQRLPGRKVEVTTGLFGNLRGTVEQAAQGRPDAVAVAIEWPDLDPRLGYRNLGGWGTAVEVDIVEQVQRSLADLKRAIETAARNAPLVVSLPTLRLPPVFHTSGWQAGRSQAAIQAALAQFCADLSEADGVSVVNADRIEAASPRAAAFDLKSELFAGLPYSLQHASALGEAIAALVSPTAPKKGLITDLDDTLWSGIVGEVGPEAVYWDLDHRAQLHGLYQQTLDALADQGVLVAVASKNDPAVADRALGRSDMLLSRDKIFPVEVHWHAKSGSVSRVLKDWNISADSIVFVDDSPMELDEVRQAHPGIECLLFPKSDYAAAEEFLRRLRDLFGKPRLSREDALRRESLRKAAEFQAGMNEAGQDASDDFLRGLNAVIAVQKCAWDDPRSRELVNKTNQFNLNGRRYEPVDWSQAAARPGAFLWSVAYQDKFGPLGTIAVIGGQIQDQRAGIDIWVMSCRAFARRIEHQCLRLLFDQAGDITFCFQPTERNGPLQQFLQSMLGQAPSPRAELSRENFLQRLPALPHTVREAPPLGEPSADQQRTHE